MYIRFRKLSDLQIDSAATLESMEQRLDTLVIAINALSLVEGKNPFVVAPIQNSTLHVSCCRVSFTHLLIINIYSSLRNEEKWVVTSPKINSAPGAETWKSSISQQ